MQIKTKMRRKTHFFKLTLIKYYEKLTKNKDYKYWLIGRTLIGILLFDIFVILSIVIIEIPLFLTQKLEPEFIVFLNSLNFVLLLMIMISIILGIILYIYAEYYIYREDNIEK